MFDGDNTAGSYTTTATTTTAMPRERAFVRRRDEPSLAFTNSQLHTVTESAHSLARSLAGWARESLPLEEKALRAERREKHESLLSSGMPRALD